MEFGFPLLLPSRLPFCYRASSLLKKGNNINIKTGHPVFFDSFLFQKDEIGKKKKNNKNQEKRINRKKIELYLPSSFSKMNIEKEFSDE